MRTEQTPAIIRLQDYVPPRFGIEQTHLDIHIHSDHSIVTATLHMMRFHSADELILDAGELLDIEWLELDGVQVEHFRQVGEQLILTAPSNERFVLRSRVRINPAQNTTLEGLYCSGGMYCTQCEAQGFRQITPYLDRPDVLSIFTTRIEAPMSYPQLLSNGNRIDTGGCGSDRHFSVWHDPFPKPSYLFAMVAGDLHRTQQSFTTCSGRTVTLELFTEAHNAHKTEFALASLKRAMLWDEQTYGREYDLDLYMIVAVDHFNMGAMENKGLNIFNSACVLADEASTTDRGFENIESIVAHEYFHNWSGNRVTCRDWFQLSLKEGFTVFRDSQFTADTHHAAVKRIDDVQLLINHQFAEDAGPMAHPVRPSEYIEINNFYTLTVYEKGAEVVRMLHTLLGTEMFRAATDLYFTRFDGSAATVEDFVACMAEVSGLDLTQFQRWYHQAGTPEVDVVVEHDPTRQTLALHFKQRGSRHLKALDYEPLHIPVKLGLLDAEDGTPVPILTQHPNFNMETGVFSLCALADTLMCEQVPAPVVASLFRSFSAPVRYQAGATAEDLELLVRYDQDEFNRWFAWQKLATDALLTMIFEQAHAEPAVLQLIRTMGHVLADDQLKPAIKARLLSLPSFETLANASPSIDPLAIAHARILLQTQLAQQHHSLWLTLFEQTRATTPYRFNADAAGQRALHLVALDYLMWVDDAGWQYAQELFEQADNMTERNGALLCWSQRPNQAWHHAMEAFYQTWASDAQVVERWLSMLATSPAMGASDIEQLIQHEAFSWQNPNRVRSVVGAFCLRNPTGFFAADESGFDLLLAAIIRLNQSNPQIAARLCTPFTQWRRYVPDIQKALHNRLSELSKRTDLSAGVYEIVSKSLAGS